MRLSKKERHAQLLQKIAEVPFLTDEDLAKQFSVSIPTIRLDRLELGIPELRERVKTMAERNLDKVKSLALDEVIGDVIDVQLNYSGISIFEIQKQHVFQKTSIARGHYLFAQANSLAVAIIDADVVLTAAADIRFLRPVYLGEKCIAKATTSDPSPVKGMYVITVEIFVHNDKVFEGQFKVTRYTEKSMMD